MNDDMKVADLIATLRESNLNKEARIETLEKDIKQWKEAWRASNDEHSIDLARLDNLRNASTLLEERAEHDREQLRIADGALNIALAEAKKYKDAYMHTCDNHKLHAEIKNLKEFKEALLKDMEYMENKNNTSDAVIAALHQQIESIQTENEEQIKQLEKAVEIERKNYIEAEADRIRAKGSLDFKQAEIRKERQLRGKAEETLAKVMEDRNYWQGLAEDRYEELEQCKKDAQTSHDQAVKYANRLGQISNVLNERD